MSSNAKRTSIVRNKSRLDAHLEVARAAMDDLDQTSEPDVDQTSEPPVEQTSIPPSESLVLQTSDPPTQHEFTIHLTDPDETVTLVSQFRRLPGGKAVKGMAALKNMISKCDYHSYGQVIVIGDFVPGKQLRIDVGKSI
eukprot:gene28000-34619_t